MRHMNQTEEILHKIDLHRNSINALEGALHHTDTEAYNAYMLASYPELRHRQQLDHIVDAMKGMYESSMNGANDPECAYWNKAIDACIELVNLVGTQGLASIVAAADHDIADAPPGSEWHASFPKGSSKYGTLVIGDKAYTMYVADIVGTVISPSLIKHKYTLIEA